MSGRGNVVLGYTSDTTLMLDCDLKAEDEVIRFAKGYTKMHDLGSVVVFKTSNSKQIDLFKKKLGNYCVIFGKPLSWEEILFHVEQCLRLGIVNRQFANMRSLGAITIRVNAKNSRTPAPLPVFYYKNGDRRGIGNFTRYWRQFRAEG